MYWLHVGALSGLKVTAILVFSFWASLWTSIIVYRLFFHRLREFPGPVLARVSKLYHASRILRRNNFEVIQEWHDMYGPIVRVGTFLAFFAMEMGSIVFLT
jgi:tryprostatin B 6-hydroxylase